MNKWFPFRLDIAASPGQNDNEYKFLSVTTSHLHAVKYCSQLRAVDVIYV